jgi:DNA-binding winged helix-turn-helix (wHTH) protein/TolB-like protein/Tfp pilus assembly protein PilF
MDVVERVLWRGAERVPLSLKAFDTLLILVRAGGHLVLKEELLKAVWPDSFVEEGSLTQNISLIRKALEGTGEGRKYIETVPRRGYRFVAALREKAGDGVGQEASRAEEEPNETAGGPEADPSAVLRPASRAPEESNRTERHEPTASGRLRPTLLKRLTGKKGYAYLLLTTAVLITAAATLLLRQYSHGVRDAGPVTQVKSIAILPFNTIGLDGERELLGLGMADALILRLSRLERPVVLPTGTIIRYTRRDKSGVEIARDLGAEAVLDGTVQRADGRVRVTAQLIRVEDGRSLWSGALEEADRDVFRLQDALADQLAESLLAGVRSPDSAAARPYTQNPEAYQDYLMGIFFWSKGGKEDMGKAINYFKGAVEKDPGFALAHAYLADSYYYIAASGFDLVTEGEARASARESVRKALELDETIAQAHMALAGLDTLDGDYVEAEGEYQRALLLNQNFAIAHNRYGVFLFHRGDIEGTVRELRRGQELDPTAPVTNQALSYMLLFARRYDEALYYGRRSVELEPSNSFSWGVMGEAYQMKGLEDEAINSFNKMMEMGEKNRHYYIAHVEIVISYALSGRQELARRKLTELLHDPKARAALRPYALACAYATLGDREEAFKQLSKEKQTMDTLSTLKFEPLLDPLRGDPRFDQLLNRPVEGYQ